MWIEFLNQLSKNCEYSDPANWWEIETIEKKLRVTLHKDLVSILKEANGIFGEYGLGLLWSTSRIEEDNLSFRANKEFKDLYMPFDNLLFFADAGNGDQFAYPILNDLRQRNDIFVWNHEDDSRKWVAPNLKSYFEWWLNGRLTI